MITLMNVPVYNAATRVRAACVADQRGDWLLAAQLRNTRAPLVLNDDDYGPVPTNPLPVAAANVYARPLLRRLGELVETETDQLVNEGMLLAWYEPATPVPLRMYHERLRYWYVGVGPDPELEPVDSNTHASVQTGRAVLEVGSYNEKPQLPILHLSCWDLRKVGLLYVPGYREDPDMGRVPAEARADAPPNVARYM